MRCGMLERDETEGIQIGCPTCDERMVIDGEDCPACNGFGYFTLDKPPIDFVGWELMDAIRIIGLCGDGVLPIAGGLLDQSAWFVDVWQLLRSDEAKFQAEAMKHGR